MAKRKTQITGAGEVGFNMTPMIDCTFQLIIFFILASQVANDAYAKNVHVPRPHASMSVPIDKMPLNKVTINVISMDPMGETDDPLDDCQAREYKIATDRFDIGEHDRMVERIKNIKDQAVASGVVVEGDPAKEFFIEVRADKKINWEFVAPVIRAGVEAGVRKMNITALTAQL